MIELDNDSLEVYFPEVHPKARCSISFQRTLRLPDDGKTYPLPPGLGCFPLKHVDDLGRKTPSFWKKTGGVFMPMWQSEALWIHFSANYPMAIKVAAGKINAITGAQWSNELNCDPQDYLVVPDQPWLDGFCVDKGKIRQFVAMPLGEGYTAEEQITGKAENGGLQFIIYPMKKERYEKEERFKLEVKYMMSSPMGLAPGGLMEQDIYEDKYGIDAWDTTHASRCFVHIVNSKDYYMLTGSPPPYPPIQAREYAQYGLPWFEYFDDLKALEGSEILAGLKGIGQMTQEKIGITLAEDMSFDILEDDIVSLDSQGDKRRRRKQVREVP